MSSSELKSISSLSVGQYLRRCREQRGMSLAELSSSLGFKTVQHLSNVERGLSPIGVKVIRAYINKCGVSPDQVLDLSGYDHVCSLRNALNREH